MKKSLLILPSIILLFLVNACTPLPTGGPVSANIIYKVQNKKGKIIPIGQTSNQFDSLPIEINNDNINDFYLIRNNSSPILISIAPVNNTKFAITSFAGSYLMSHYFLSQPIGSTDYWQTGLPAIMQSYDGTTVDAGDFGTNIYGLQIKNGMDFNYAWIRIDCNALTKEVTIIESAYNTIPNQPILAGKK